jgi:hypothetical protein
MLVSVVSCDVMLTLSSDAFFEVLPSLSIDETERVIAVNCLPIFLANFIAAEDIQSFGTS